MGNKKLIIPICAKGLKSIYLFFICIMLILASHGWAQENITTDNNIQSGEHKYNVDGNRKYLLYIPTTYNTKKPAPLVLFFHGGGGHMEQAALDYGWKEKADKERFILAFPNGSSRLPSQRLATWNAGECCGYARDKKVDDMGFMRQTQ
jgi:poly(3-hydroxybutyrate) depolymerase